VSEVSKPRQRTTGGTEARGTAHAEARGRRHRAGDQAKVAAQYIIGMLKSDLIM
jgi:hypothetical protein